MNKQERLAKESEAAVQVALKVTDNDILKSIEEGSVDKALKNVSKAKKASNKAPSAKGPKAQAKQDSHIYKEASYGGLNAKDKKVYRRKARKLRNKFIKQIVALHKAKDRGARDEAMASFIKFYKKTYKLNDMSVESLSAKNSDQDTKDNLKELLTIMKRIKSK